MSWLIVSLLLSHRLSSVSISLFSRRLCLLAGVVVISSQTGCYYTHLARGQLELLWQREPIEAVLADPSQPEDVRRLLALVDEVRSFAQGLGLEVDGQYTSYVDWPGDRVVTTVVRTHAGRLEIAPWWFPIVGRLPYKGYFDRTRAEREAERLLESGRYDVCVSGVVAYSTLGWLKDPVTGPMLRRGAASLVETLFHELVHVTAFLPGQADFNEGAALFIGQQAAIRFFAARDARGLPRPPDWPDATRVRAMIDDRRRIAGVLLDLREEVAALDGRPDRAALRARLETAARARLEALPLEVFDSRQVAARARLGDACLALRGTYVRDLPRHEALLSALDGDLARLVARLRRWALEERPPAAFFTPPAPL